MDVCSHCTLLGERCITQRSGPVALQGGVVGLYSSGELGIVDHVCARRCTRLATRAQPMHIPPTCLILTSVLTSDMPSFLIDMTFDEVSQGRFSEMTLFY